MADEKKENYRENYTRLFNPILEAIMLGNFNGRELKVILFVIRCTYGWNKKAYPMSQQFIAEGTGLDKRKAGTITRELVKRRVLIYYGTDKKTRAKIYGLNKKYGQWNSTVSTAEGADMCAENDSVKNGAVCAPKSTNECAEGGADMYAESGAQKRHIKRHISKEKEKKCTQKEHFFLNEDGTWERSVEDAEEGSGEE